MSLRFRSVEDLPSHLREQIEAQGGTTAKLAQSKYHNEPVIHDGQRFDSKVERDCYLWLLARQTTTDEVQSMPMTPTQLSLRELRARGYPLVQVVERWNPHARVRQDLFGIVDVLAVGADIVAVQTTSASNAASRVRKLTDSQALAVLRWVGIRVLVHAWRKQGHRYVLREIDLS